MKTITEYRPMIYRWLLDRSKKRHFRRRQLLIDASAVTAYCLPGLWLMWDTGIAPWEWQFWTCLGPLLIAGELAFNALAAEGWRVASLGEGRRVRD